VTEALPYIVILLTLALVIKPYVQKCPEIGVKKMYAYGFQQLDYRYMFVFVAYVVYILFAVFKKIDYNFGAKDAYYYMQYFADIPRSFILYMTQITTFELGYSAVTWLFRQFTADYRIMLWFWHTLTFCLTVKFLRKIDLKKYAFLPVFLILFTLVSQFNTLRMSVSIAIALMALPALNEEKWIKSFLIIIIAASMQISAAILIPVWIVVFIIKHRDYPVRLIILFTLLGLAATVFLMGYVLAFMAGTAKGVYLGESSLAIGTYCAVLVIFVLCVIKYREMVRLNPLNQIFIIMLPICFLCVPLQLKAAIMYRLTLYFVPVMMALIPSLCQCYNTRKHSAVGAAVVCILYAYAFYRAYSFFTEEIISVGPYVSTLLGMVLK
jgi:hypothetical protein